MGGLEGAGIPDPLLEFSVWSLKRHHLLAAELKDASGVDHQFQVHGALKLAFDEQQVLEFNETLKWQRNVDGFQVEWLTPEEAVKVEPMANPDNLGAVYLQGVASVEPYRYTLAAGRCPSWGKRRG